MDPPSGGSGPAAGVGGEILTGETFAVEFRWLQTAISLRRADAVDVKFTVNGQGRTVALPHGPLERACRLRALPLTDELCIRLAAEYLRQVLETGEDAGQGLLAVPDARVDGLFEQS